ncbi:MAG: aldo/keto reductase [Nanoarchaeota archaeon]|nr:aldo/keto reductase [Nanoarchaeota archaeon]
MEYRKLGRTELNVSLISLGGAQLEAVNELQAKQVIDKAISLGMNFIDTAVKYKEEKLKLALSTNKRKIIVASKSTEPGKEEIIKNVKASVHKLGIRKIHLYQLHGVDDEGGLHYKLNHALKGLKEMQKGKLIEWIGVHGQNINVLKKAVKTEEFDTVMLPYNYAYDEAEELIDIAYDRGVGIIVMEPFGRGLIVNPDRLNVDPKGEEKGFLNHETALKWIISNKKISTVIPGGNKVEYVRKNASVMDKQYLFSREKRDTIHTAVKALVKNEYFRLCDNPWGGK